MKNGLIGSLATLLTGAGLALAEAPPTVAPAAPAVPVPAGVLPSLGGTGAPCDPGCLSCNDCCECPTRFYGSAEYLLWKIKDQPIPVPLVSTNGNPAVLPFLGTPGTSVLFGNTGRDMGIFSGTRATAGYWLDSNRTLGIEASGFMLEQRTKTFTASGSPTSSSLGIPFLDTTSGNHIFFTANGPVGPNGDTVGGVTISNTSRLWGAECNALYNLTRASSWNLALLGGFRYLDLEEKLALANTANIPGAVQFDESDNFQTRDQFYGGQLGVRAGFTWGRLSVDATGKVALGYNRESVNVQGSTATSAGGTTTVVPGGIFAQPTNSGRRTADGFSVVPEAEIKAGYSLGRSVRAAVGYNFLDWNNVVRPGNQIDNVMSFPQAGTRPEPLLGRTDFWAQGVSFGLEFRF